ncbi:unnamed protein product [Linum trigynum]|uniref:Uncharacterized protein n=1 Tax=Linum trigynum TaxID=586398 RepID=A0AAV2E078_9ROSI
MPEEVVEVAALGAPSIPDDSSFGDKNLLLSESYASASPLILEPSFRGGFFLLPVDPNQRRRILLSSSAGRWSLRGREMGTERYRCGEKFF